MFEIGYMLYHRSSIFFISAILAINAFGMVMIYLITFSGIMTSISIDSLNSEGDDTKTGI